MKSIYFDMDGTIADLYGVSGWLDSLQEEDTKPYALAKPMMDMKRLATMLSALKNRGYHVGVISWTSKNGSEEYNQKVAEVKINWLRKNLLAVLMDEIKIVPYGTPKSEAVDFPAGILFDDEENNRTNWTGKAYTPEYIIDVLKAL